MKPDQPSETAQRAAVRRAMHQLVDRPLVFEDPLAMRIIGREAAVELAMDEPLARRDRIRTGLRALLVVRTRLAEEELATAVGDGTTQYVVLGAGLDTFAYRNPYGPRLRVFEVDQPLTQRFKRDRLAEVEIAAPDNVTFVPVDLETQSLAGELRAAGFDGAARSFFSWLGVVPYLTPEVVRETLGAIAALAAPGGTIVFDYATSPDTLPPYRRTLFDLFAERLKALGEPLRSFFEPAALAAELESLGFRDVIDHGPEALNARYLSQRSDGLQLGGLGRIMQASL